MPKRVWKFTTSIRAAVEPLWKLRDAAVTQGKKKPRRSAVPWYFRDIDLVERMGIEPTTSTMRT